MADRRAKPIDESAAATGRSARDTQAVLPQRRPLVLVVDDEPELVRVTARFLDGANIDSIGCSDGAQALAILESRKVDAIISDISMPNMSGLELVKAVRKRDLHLPVIMVTGGRSFESAVKAIEVGVYRYLVKPVPPNDLIEATSRAIQLCQLARAKEELLQEMGSSTGMQSDRVGLEAVFESAMSSLWPAFQPIVSTKDRSLFGYEALLRTDEPALPHPGAVLDAAERLGQLPRLFRTMRDRTCQVFADGGYKWNLFLNLHPRDLNDMGLLDPNTLVFKCAKHIVLEITERATLDHVVDVASRIKRLREVGYRIAIDDLGAGYAGLNSFASLEPDFVKFDMGLVRNIHQSSVRQRLMRVITALCHDMGKQVVAEGIEIVEERDTVIALGCDLLQGYRLGKPNRALMEPVW